MRLVFLHGCCLLGVPQAAQQSVGMHIMMHREHLHSFFQPQGIEDLRGAAPRE